MNSVTPAATRPKHPRNTANIRYVMKAGTLYDAMSLDEIWPKAKPYGDNYWYVPQLHEKSVKAVGVYDKK